MQYILQEDKANGYKVVKSMLIYIRVEVAPYWNVNTDYVEFKKGGVLVEVAPYWNVNSFIAGSRMFKCRSRSSSILECKYLFDYLYL